MAKTNSIDIDCCCGSVGCHSNLHFRRGNVYTSDGTVPGWLHIDASDMEGKWVEFMLDPKEARYLMWFLIKKFLFRRT